MGACESPKKLSSSLSRSLPPSLSPSLGTSSKTGFRPSCVRAEHCKGREGGREGGRMRE